MDQFQVIGPTQLFCFNDPGTHQPLLVYGQPVAPALMPMNSMPNVMLSPHLGPSPVGNAPITLPLSVPPPTALLPPATPQNESIARPVEEQSIESNLPPRPPASDRSHPSVSDEPLEGEIDVEVDPETGTTIITYHKMSAPSTSAKIIIEASPPSAARQKPSHSLENGHPEPPLVEQQKPVEETRSTDEGRSVEEPLTVEVKKTVIEEKTAEEKKTVEEKKQAEEAKKVGMKKEPVSPQVSPQPSTRPAEPEPVRTASTAFDRLSLLAQIATSQAAPMPQLNGRGGVLPPQVSLPVRLPPPKHPRISAPIRQHILTKNSIWSNPPLSTLPPPQMRGPIPKPFCISQSLMQTLTNSSPLIQSQVPPPRPPSPNTQINQILSKFAPIPPPKPVGSKEPEVSQPLPSVPRIPQPPRRRGRPNATAPPCSPSAAYMRNYRLRQKEKAQKRKLLEQSHADPESTKVKEIMDAIRQQMSPPKQQREAASPTKIDPKLEPVSETKSV